MSDLRWCLVLLGNIVVLGRVRHSFCSVSHRRRQLLMLLSVKITTRDEGRVSREFLGGLTGFLTVSCKTETTVVDTVGLAPMLKSVEVE